MNCPHCRKGWADIDVAGEVEHDLCPDCNGTGVAPVPASPIRDSAGKLAITPGVWELSKSGMNVDRPTFKSEAYCGGASFLSACSHQWKRKADAALIAEAGTVTNQTGRTPAELAALVRELREALATYRKHDPYFMDDNLLAKSEGV